MWPLARAMRPCSTGHVVRRGGATSAPGISSTVRSSTPDSCRAASSATSSRPSTKAIPRLSRLTVSKDEPAVSAIASSAAILGAACAPSADQPAVSRILAKRNVPAKPSSSATSANSGASCVQATVRVANSPSALRKVSSWARQSWLAGLPLVPSVSPARVMVPSQVQIRRASFWSRMGLSSGFRLDYLRACVVRSVRDG